MKPKLSNENVVARCPDCDGVITTFEFRDSSQQFGKIHVNKIVKLKEKTFNRVTYRLLRCASCGRGGLAELYDNKDEKYFLGHFFHSPLKKRRYLKTYLQGLSLNSERPSFVLLLGDLELHRPSFDPLLKKY